MVEIWIHTKLKQRNEIEWIRPIYISRRGNETNYGNYRQRIGWMGVVEIKLVGWIIRMCNFSIWIEKLEYTGKWYCIWTFYQMH